MKSINEIPSIYIDDENELDIKLGGIINGNKLN